ncbi:FtsQ-type POTRA domain-containing protein [Mariniblastus fucicola]|uniref:Uncharacterized protein n=1 Tax=Mariniblastus fucicola TaxID=980251 RepID=A0A5B9PHE9_9BACT|nr:FtsQ-type POTRA domain-containing protein [Mariniblastus fucicola]QEG24056.1 hypothetical protein MFFC18_39720 [Mariniblastus fucicola]
MLVRPAFVAILLYSLLVVEANAQSNETLLDCFGLKKITREQIEKAIGMTDGIPSSGIEKQQIKERVAAIPGVEEVTVSPVQYPGTTVVFIGIRESGQPAREFRDAPTGDVQLEDDLQNRYNEIMEQLLPAIKSGKAREDGSAGHSISEYEPMKEKQLELLPIADEKFDHLADVIRNSSNKDSRAAAASIVAYAKDKKAVIEILKSACDDPNSLVRNNGVRALSVIAKYADDNPKLDLVIDHSPFLKLLNSVVWTDRNKGAAVVDALTRNRSEQLMSQLRESHLSDLLEMARWSSGGHALFSIRILARLADETEEAISKRSRECKTHEDRLKWVDELEGKLSREPG